MAHNPFQSSYQLSQELGMYTLLRLVEFDERNSIKLEGVAITI